ncbi:hypothetical protein JO40_11305 [Treponema putidum]|nr:hypothetical protein JO40_11305 [Treponema putidum]
MPLIIESFIKASKKNQALTKAEKSICKYSKTTKFCIIKLLFFVYSLLKSIKLCYHYYSRKIFYGGRINSSAGILPHCLSASFVLCTKPRLLYVVLPCKTT